MEIVESERERKWGLLEIVECKAFLKIMCINLRFIFSRTMIYLPFLLFIFSFLCALRLVVPSKPLSGFEHYNIMIKTRRGWHSKLYSVWILGQMRKLLITLRFVPRFHPHRAFEGRKAENSTCHFVVTIFFTHEEPFNVETECWTYLWPENFSFIYAAFFQDAKHFFLLFSPRLRHSIFWWMASFSPLHSIVFIMSKLHYSGCYANIIIWMFSTARPPASQ